MSGSVSGERCEPLRAVGLARGRRGRALSTKFASMLYSVSRLDEYVGENKDYYGGVMLLMVVRADD